MKYRRNRWNWSDSWLSRRLTIGKGIRERFCSKCRQPFVQSPEAKPEEQFFSCSAAVLVYPTRHAGRKKYVVRLGRWRPNKSRLDLVQIFDADDIGDLRVALEQAEEYINGKKKSHRDPNRRTLRLASDK